MRDLNMRMQRLMNDRMREQGASLAQFKLLRLIDHSGFIRAIDICDTFGYAPRTVTEAIDALEREGLVLRTPDPNDRRAKRITITDAGRAVIREVDPCRQTFISEFFEVLTQADEVEMLRLLNMLNQRLIELGAPVPNDAGRMGMLTEQ